MTTETLRENVSAVIRGWLLWLPVLLFPFGILAIDTWLNTESINRDYRLAELNGEIRKSQDELKMLSVREARLSKMDRIEMEAPDLGLHPPEPNQIRLIYYTKSGGPSAGTAESGALASLREESLPSAPVQSTKPVPETAPRKENEGCSSSSNTTPTNVLAVVQRLRQAIGTVCASCFGDS